METKNRDRDRDRAQAEDRPEANREQSGAMQSLVGVESLIQLALFLPVATMVGWGIGVGLDHLLHQTWIYIAGLVVGAAAGFIEIFRVVLKHTKE